MEVSEVEAPPPSVQLQQQTPQRKNGVKGHGHGHSRDRDLRKTSIDSDSGNPSPTQLLANVARDYSRYLKTDISIQISKVEEFVEESVMKVEEWQGLFEMKDSERRAWSSQILPDIIRTGTLLSITLNQRLDTLASLILSIQTTLDTLEAQIVQAENKLGIPSPTSNASTAAIRSVFKYFVSLDFQVFQAPINLIPTNLDKSRGSMSRNRAGCAHKEDKSTDGATTEGSKSFGADTVFSHVMLNVGQISFSCKGSHPPTHTAIPEQTSWTQGTLLNY